MQALPEAHGGFKMHSCDEPRRRLLVMGPPAVHERSLAFSNGPVHRQRHVSILLISSYAASLGVPLADGSCSPPFLNLDGALLGGARCPS